MRRLIAAAVVAIVGTLAGAQDFSGLARLDVTQSVVRDEGRGIAVDLYLSQSVPWRVFTLDEPRRLVMDFREIDWRGASKDQLLQSERVEDLRFGALRPGWSRLVVDLGRPVVISTAEMQVNTVDGTAAVHVVMDLATEEAFAATVGAPPDPGWDMLQSVDVTEAPAEPVDDGLLVVAVDPGHGGIDPGAERGGLKEADVMLQLASELTEALNRVGGMRAIMTRKVDQFVPLEERMTIARLAGADVFVSLHADALEGDDLTSGATVYTLSPEAANDASNRMAERHDRGDLLAGLDLSGQDDTVATVLMDLARLETGPASISLANTLIVALDDAGASVADTPRREAALAVLNSADFPSVLVEVGFLSNVKDREALRRPEGRARIAAGIVLGLQRWAAEQAAINDLKRR